MAAIKHLPQCLNQYLKWSAVPHRLVHDPDGTKFVFQQTGETRFRRIDVQTGRETADLVEIISGLQARDEVVDAGAFYLKSELLLERE